MKRILLLVTIIFAAFICHAQVSDADAAKALQLVSASKSDIGLSEKDLSQVKVTTSYFDRSTGLTMVYLQQTYAGIPILKQILPLAFKDGKLVSKAGAFEHSMDQLVNAKSGIPAVSASSAVQFAIADRKLTSSKIPFVISTKENGRKIEYNDMGVSHENITAELLWVPYEESIKKGNTVSTVTRMRLAWQVYIIQTTSSDYWLVCVDAMDNKTLRVDNLTVYDHWGHPSDTKPGTTPALINGISKPGEPGNDPFGTKNIFTASGQTPHSPLAVNSSSYRVIPYPAESPNVSAPAIRTSPWLAAPGNATTLGWHTGLAAAEYDYTRGNNVWAYQDRVAPVNTGSIAKSASSTTALPDLTFDFVPNFTVDPLQETPVPNKQFNVTNLFYWNNIIHDVMYQYGFDEPAHNFQDDNLGRGGVGNDHVNAEAQDGAGSNNANFSTPNDGGSGRMQMFLWNLNGVNPLRDGDVDNGIVVHEYGHGISIRLTGGGATVCLSGAEQMGEGWSDYYGLMFTTNWATASVNDGFNIPRHIGTYALNNVSLFTCPYPAPIPPCTATPNLGIRHFPYSTNMAVNPWVYATVIPSSVHDRGEIWAATLWDMTWNLIQQRGISPSLYDATATGGNVVAMRLVTLGLKLQPCSVGFVDGRNAILAADQALYGGANQCLIWEAFARRGIGFSASQGSSGSVTDQTAAFDLAPACLTTPFIVSAGSAITAETCLPPNSAIDPNETVTVDFTLSNASPINTTNLVATLQATGGVTSPSGPQNYGVVVTGTPVTRSFSFTADNLACGGQLTATLQLQDGATNLGTITYTFSLGALVAVISENFDGVTAPALPAGWVATNVTGAAPLWVTSSAGVPSPAAASAPNSIFIDDPAVVSDKEIVTPTFTPGATDKLSFANNFILESTYDGGVLEISINGGAFTDIITAGGSFVTGGYNAAISASFGSPIAGRQAWTGTSPGGFITTTVNLPAAAVGLPCQLKFRMGSDNSVSASGWRVDNLTISTRVCCTNICTPPVITVPTVTQPTCATQTGTIVVNATGGGTLEYSVDNGSTYQASATFSGLATGNYNIKVRLQSSPLCEAAYVNNPVVLSEATGCCVPPTITAPTVTQPTCVTPTGTIVVNATGNSPLEYSVDNGANWQPSATFSGLVPSNYYIISVRHISNPTCASTYDRNPVVIHAPELPVVGIGFDGPLTFCAGGSVNLFAGVIYPNFLRVQTPYNIDMSIGTSPTIGPPITTTPVNGDFVYIPDATASYLGCNPYTAGSLTGKVALIDRGTCLFATKVKNAQDAGAIAVIIVNSFGTTPVNMGSSDPTITIPVISVSQLDGAILKNMISQGTTNGSTLQHTYGNYLWSNGATTTTINVTQSGTFTVQATDENGCTGTSLPVEVIVNPVPDAVATPSSQSICTGSAITTIVLSGAVSGTVFNWTRDNTVDVTGIAANGTGDISGTLTNNTAAPVTVTFTITPSYTNAEVTCTGTPITATVTVNPAIYFACPGNMVETITNQNIPCFKAVQTPNPVFCGTLTKLTWKLTGATLLSSPTSGINYLGLRNMNVGTTTVTYTATFTGAIVRTCSFTVLVIETVPPNIYCPLDKTVTTDVGKCYKTGPVSLGTPVVSDNCGVASVTNNAPAVYQKGVNLVTWTVTDKSGNTRTCVQRVTVTDAERPTITCPVSLIVDADPGPGCAKANLTLPLPVFNDNCGVVTLTWAMVGVTYGSSGNTGINYVPTMNYLVGISTVTYTAIDEAGNSRTCTFRVTVRDVTAPVLVCPPSETFCKLANNTYSVPPLVQSDNCVIVSTTFKITGATSRTGSGTNASGIFNQGVSTILWTVKDSHGNISTCTTVITVVATSNPVCAPPPFTESGSNPKFTEAAVAGLSIIAWPNPTVNYFNLRVTSQAKENVVIRMFDMAGKQVQVKRGAAGDNYILGEGVVSGMYFIEVSQGDKTARTKVVKQ